MANWAQSTTPANVRRGLASLLPSFLKDFILHRLSNWRYFGESWPAKAPDGWRNPNVAVVQKQHWPFLVRATTGSGPLGVSHFPWRLTTDNPEDQNIVMSFAYVLLLTAHDCGDRLSILDWGGSLGHYRLYADALLPEIDIDYHCFDLPHLCEAGRDLLPTARYHSDPVTLEGLSFDLVIASSSLHYADDWRATLDLLATKTRHLLYIARLQTVASHSSFIVEQASRKAGYRSPYLSWFINRDELREHCDSLGLCLKREFVFDERWFVRRAPEQGRSWGFLLARANKPPQSS